MIGLVGINRLKWKLEINESDKEAMKAKNPRSNLTEAYVERCMMHQYR